ncbi:MAG: EVE domain-containing protein [Myxacorys chilensis ATA2-1-KO14]|jgi:predicted RNA-binding protein|nr:EVE domain-containing protein [Myxacorys chilensis ATA2-1-KO14]
MSDRTYWLSLFNTTTWQEFQDAGAEVMGFPETRQNTVRRIKPGDYLLGYLTGVSRWIAVLEVTSEPYDDLSRIWKQALFPCRVKVKVVANVPLEAGVPVLSISKELRMFDNMKTPNWGLLFRIAPRELHPSDGELITNAVKQAALT